MKLQGKVALVAGGAQGIGRASVLAFAREGAGVAIVDLDLERAQGTRDEAEGLGARAIALGVDVSDSGRLAEAFHECRERLGPVDILVNDAGTGSRSRGLEIADDDWDRVMNVNLKAQFVACKLAVPGMMERGWGRVINISSSAAFSGTNIADLAYCASKAGILGMTRSLAKLVAKRGVTVNAIAPGMIDTEFPTRGGRRTPEEWERQLSSVPMGRMGTAEEVAEVVLFLATDSARYITGCTLSVSGGGLLH